jgi:hypothetical protein
MMRRRTVGISRNVRRLSNTHPLRKTIEAAVAQMSKADPIVRALADAGSSVRTAPSQA